MTLRVEAQKARYRPCRIPGMVRLNRSIPPIARIFAAQAVEFGIMCQLRSPDSDQHLKAEQPDPCRAP